MGYVIIKGSHKNKIKNEIEKSIGKQKWEDSFDPMINESLANILESITKKRISNNKKKFKKTIKAYISKDNIQIIKNSVIYSRNLDKIEINEMEARIDNIENRNCKIDSIIN